MSIKEARTAAGLTQKQFSKIFKIPIDVIKSWDSGRRNPPEWAEFLIIEKLDSLTKKKEVHGMYEFYRFNKEECEEIADIIRAATDIWTKDLPPLFRGTLVEETENIIDRMFDGENEIGEISCKLAIEDVIIPAVKMIFKDLKNEKLKILLSKFICETDGSTLYKVLEDEVLKKEREEILTKSYKTKENALLAGLENPVKYHCWECGNVFWAEWRSKYSSPAICPVCGTEDRILE